MAKKSITSTLSNIFGAQAQAAKDINEALDSISDQLAAAHNRLADTRNAPVPVSEVELRIDELLDMAERRARGSFVPGVISLPGRSAHESRIEEIVGSSSGERALGGLILCGMRDIIQKALVGEAISAMQGEPLDEKTRAASIREIESEIAELERSREKLIRQAARAGVRIARSELADAAVLLAPDGEL